MLASQTHALSASEIRKRLAELAAVEEMNDELRSEIGTLRVEYTDVEAKYQAAVTAEDTRPRRAPMMLRVARFAA